MHITKSVIYLPLNISDGGDLTHDGVLKSLLAAMYNDVKYKSMIKI